MTSTALAEARRELVKLREERDALVDFVGTLADGKIATLEIAQNAAAVQIQEKKYAPSGRLGRERSAHAAELAKARQDHQREVQKLKADVAEAIAWQRDVMKHVRSSEYDDWDVTDADLVCDALNAAHKVLTAAAEAVGITDDVDRLVYRVDDIMALVARAHRTPTEGYSLIAALGSLRVLADAHGAAQVAVLRVLWDEGAPADVLAEAMGITVDQVRRLVAKG